MAQALQHNQTKASVWIAFMAADWISNVRPRKELVEEARTAYCYRRRQAGLLIESQHVEIRLRGKHDQTTIRCTFVQRLRQVLISLDS